MDEVELSEEQRRVLIATSGVEVAGQPFLQAIARRADLPQDRVRELLSQLVNQDLLEEDWTEQPGDPSMGPRYRVRSQPSPP